MNLCFRGLGLALCLCVLGCARFQSQQGVEALWSDARTLVFETGQTTQSEVLEALGPPSQIIAIHGGTVFYYLRETTRGTALVLLVYNQAVKHVDYDRAVFFFDEDGKLTDFSTRAPSPNP